MDWIEGEGCRCDREIKKPECFQSCRSVDTIEGIFFCRVNPPSARLLLWKFVKFILSVSRFCLKSCNSVIEIEKYKYSRKSRTFKDV